MDRDEALKLLQGGPCGIKEWNRRRAAGEEAPCLSDAVLLRAHLESADLSHVDLQGANLHGANLTYADCRGADFSFANLVRATLFATYLNGAKVFRTQFGQTVIASFLDGVLGLDKVLHGSFSVVDINSVVHDDVVPEVFLRGCGLRDEEIAFVRSQVGKKSHSCVISFSTADEGFAARLHYDFQARGIRCWKWDHDARTGKSLWGQIDQAIRVHDKLVLVASESSLRSPEVQDEIERAIQKEKELRRQKEAGEYDGDVDVLFPVRLDDYIFEAWGHERKADVTKKFIADARGWDKDPEVYAKVRDRLIRDLKAEPAP